MLIGQLSLHRQSYILYMISIFSFFTSQYLCSVLKEMFGNLGPASMGQGLSFATFFVEKKRKQNVVTGATRKRHAHTRPWRHHPLRSHRLSTAAHRLPVVPTMMPTHLLLRLSTMLTMQMARNACMSVWNCPTNSATRRSLPCLMALPALLPHYHSCFCLIHSWKEPYCSRMLTRNRDCLWRSTSRWTCLKCSTSLQSYSTWGS